MTEMYFRTQFLKKFFYFQLLFFAMFAGQSSAQVPLVSEAEATTGREYASRNMAKSFAPAGAPIIELRSPTLGLPLTMPVRIEIKFNAVSPATIKPETFRVRYGALRLDITDRLRGAGKVLSSGIEVERAILPTGSHRLFVEIRDSLDRLGEQVVELEVR
jgi:hypothetical protein